MRGVHMIERDKMEPEEGSSPHARGPRMPGTQASHDFRIIPACAGSTNKLWKDSNGK